MEYTSKEFHDLIDGLVTDLSDEYEYGHDINHFLDRFLGFNALRRINPLDVVREINWCHMHNEMFMERLKETDERRFSLKFIVLLGICEQIDFVNRPFYMKEEVN